MEAAMKTYGTGETTLGERFGAKETRVVYVFCTVCFGVFPADRAGKREAGACCAEFKKGGK